MTATGWISLIPNKVLPSCVVDTRTNVTPGLSVLRSQNVFLDNTVCYYVLQTLVFFPDFSGVDLPFDWLHELPAMFD